MRVLITDGDNRATLAIARSLGRRGHYVVVGERQSPALAQTSRYCSARVVYPDPVGDSAGFVDGVANAVRELSIDVLIPVSDITTILITRHRRRFECSVPFADATVIERAADKIDVIQTAGRLGLAVPRTVVIASHSEALPPLPFPFPVVIKPSRSRVETPAGWMSTGVSFAMDRGALVRDLKGRPAHEFPVMLQERIVGPGVGVFALYRDAGPVALFSHRRVRERPPWGGVSVLSESTPLDPVARDYATRLLDEIGWQGPAMVEFKRDERDGLPKLMEINGRFWGSLQLAIDAGVDFPSLLIDRTGTPAPLPTYRVGIRNRWLWGDADALALTLFARAWPASPRHRVKAVVQFAQFWQRDLYYENPKSDDIRPWLFESARWLRQFLPTRKKRAVRGAPESVQSVQSVRRVDG
jgi:predicted ATP-grasp superfamily ATP-dependent carboligase